MTVTRFLKQALAVGALFGVTGVSSVYGATQCFATDPAVSCAGSSGATGNAGTDVNATATFTTGANTVTVVLTNVLADPRSVSQLISGVFFTVSGTASGGGLQTTNVSFVNVADHGSFSTSAGSTTWLLSNAGAAFHLDVLPGPASGPANLVIGPPGPDGTYGNANGSIGGNRPHNPFISQTVTFTLALAGVTSATTITDVAISFGTTPSTIPIPAAAWLFVSGLIAIVGIARRKSLRGEITEQMSPGVASGHPGSRAFVG